MDSDLIVRALNYHGQEFRRALDSEAESDIFENIDMREVNYLQYHQRAKEFGFEERNQRQKLHKFLGRKADLLYKSMSISEDLPIPMEADFQSDEIYAIMPPLESYMSVPGHVRRKNIYEVMKKGDPVVGMITSLQNGGFVITLMCTDGGKRREIHDLGIKCFCTVGNALPNDKHDDVFSLYHIKDLVRGAVLNEPSNPVIERLYISMKNEHLAFQFQHKLKMGLITEDDLPIHYRRSSQFKDKSYSEVLEWNLNFSNPTNIYLLGSSLGLNIHKTESFFKHFHSVKYGKEEYACALRKLQSSKWAFKRIKEGVAQFKAGNHTEAYQCLNKALHIDPESVEGLVARGALFANNNNLMKAVEDFEKALEINPQHGNAQKYLSETLIAIGKRCHEKGDIDGACKNYKRAVLINGSDEAQNALALAEKSLNSKDLTHSKTASLVDADTRQKLLLLLQDDKEKLFSKNAQPPSPSDIQVLPTSHKTHSLGIEIPLNLHDEIHLHKLPSSKKSCQQPENVIVATKVKDGDNAYGKKKLYNNNINKSPISRTETREVPVSLEERLKEYYKKVGENDELEQPFADLSQNPSIDCCNLLSEVVSASSDNSSRDTAASHIREGIWTDLQFEHKRHINAIPFSDHSNSSCQRANTASEKKGNCIIKKSFKTLNGENFNTEKKDNSKFATKAYDRSCRLNISQRNLESSLSRSHNERGFRKSQSLRKFKTCVYGKSTSTSDKDIYSSHKYPYHTSSRCDGQRSISISSQKSHLIESKHYRNYHHIPHKYSSPVLKKGDTVSSKLNKDSEASHRKERGLICRALDPEKLRQLRESAKLSRMFDVKQQSVTEKHISPIVKSEDKSAFEAAKAAAQKINEELQYTNESNDISSTQTQAFPTKKQTLLMQQQILHQMETFIKKLRSQKKTETFCNDKND